MVNFSDQQVNKWTKSFLYKLKRKYPPEKVILFGSRARGDHLQSSDVDMIVVSSTFITLSWPQRLAEVSNLWDGFVVLEPLCYTPHEFQLKQQQMGIVQRAVKEGKIIFIKPLRITTRTKGVKISK